MNLFETLAKDLNPNTAKEELRRIPLHAKLNIEATIERINKMCDEASR